MDWKGWQEVFTAWLLAALLFTAMLAFGMLDRPRLESTFTTPATSASHPGTTLRIHAGIGDSSDS
jgi:hypothetical protein